MAYDEQRLNSRLLVALLISLCLHLALLLKYGQLHAGGREMHSVGVQITLVQSTSQAAEQPRAEMPSGSDDFSLSKSVSKPRNSDEKPKARQKKKIDRSEQAPEPVPSPSSSVTPASSPAKVNDQNEQPTGIPLPGMTGRVSRAAINFDVFSGADRRHIASGQHLYVADDNGNFGISVKQEPGASGANAESPWHIEISGSIGNQGLSPFLYDAQGGLAQRLLAIKNGAERNSASAGSSQQWRMRDGIIDRQSLLYYFMFKPLELAGGQVLLSDGASYALFSYRFAGTESFSIAALGEVHSVKLVFSTSESSETIELWVVPDAHYLPVKARYIDKQGLITEQAATSLDFN